MLPPKLQTIRLMNGIALLNHERAEGYNNLLNKLRSNKSEDLHRLNIELVLSNFIRESKLYSHTLNNIVLIEGGKMPYGTKVDQQLYRMSIRMKELFSDLSQQDWMYYCNQCEEIILNGYDFVLAETRLGNDPREIVIRQHKELKKAALIINSLHNLPIMTAELFAVTPVFHLTGANTELMPSVLSKPA
jgi:hypothetical protein